MDIAELYQLVFNICVDFTVFQKRDVIDRVIAILPLINSFSDAVLQKQKLSMNEADYERMCLLWLDILNDMVSSIQEKDRVLLEDTVEYGLKVFLELFMEEQYVQKLREACIVET